jgi:hypothetical protein
MEILYTKVGTTKPCKYIFIQLKLIKWFFGGIPQWQKYLSKYWAFVFLKWDCWNGLWKYENDVGIDKWQQDAYVEHIIAWFIWND